MSQEEALKHGEVAKRLNRAIACLKEASAIFLDTICGAVDRLPYCLLYSARVLRAALLEKFPQAPEKDVLKVGEHRTGCVLADTVRVSCALAIL